MFKVEVFHNNGKIMDRLYNQFQNAFSDVINAESCIHATLDQFNIAVNAEQPSKIYFGGLKPNGYCDDFHFKWDNGVVITIGEAVINDENDFNREVYQ